MAQETPRRPVLQDRAKLRRRRIEAHLTQVGLARKVGVTRGFIWQLEHGVSGASVPMLGAIADVLDCKITDLTAKGALDAPAANGTGQRAS